jgi:hypothetical protein
MSWPLDDLLSLMDVEELLDAPPSPRHWSSEIDSSGTSLMDPLYGSLALDSSEPSSFNDIQVTLIPPISQKYANILITLIHYLLGSAHPPPPFMAVGQYQTAIGGKVLRVCTH